MSNESILNALGPLASPYEDPDVSEIMVDSPDRISVERNGKIEDLLFHFDPPETLRNVIDAILALGGKTLQPDETVADVRFPDNRTRAQVILSPTNNLYLYLHLFLGISTCIQIYRTKVVPCDFWGYNIYELRE